MIKKHYLYTLVFDAEPEPVVFYVGHTNDPDRRAAEHRRAAADLKNTEYKYRWCRELTAVGIGWDFVIVGEIDDDEDSEYEWILKFARDNRSKNISFYDDLPLTNMKAGDFYHEILHRTDIKTATDIKRFRAELAHAHRQIQADYERKHRVIDYFNPTPRPLSNRAEILAAYMNKLAEERAEKDQVKRARKKKTADAYWQMITDPKRQARIEQQNKDLLEEMLKEMDHEIEHTFDDKRKTQ